MDEAKASLESSDPFNTLSWPPCDPKDIDEKYVCPKCKKVMVNAHQADDCGCRYCLTCLEQIVDHGEKQKCLKCNYEFASSFKIPDKYFQKKIKQITISKCLAGMDGCDWTGTLADYAEHFHQHFKVKPRVKCQFCDVDFAKESDLASHLNQTSGTCPKQPVECIFKTIGCNISDFSFRAMTSPASTGDQQMEISTEDNLVQQTNENVLILRENLAEHMQTNSNYHLSLIHFYYNREINAMKLKLESVVSNELSKSSASSSVPQPLTNLPHIPSKSTLTQDVNIDDSRFQLGFSNVESSKKTSETNANIEQALPLADVSSTKNFDSKLDQSYEKLSEKIDMLENNQKGLINDLTRITKNNDKLKQENSLLRDSIKEYKTICQDLHKALALTQVSLLTLEERLINQEKLSYTGSLLWKITNVHERIQEAKSGRQTSFYSPPFYTDRNGFKMCSRIYLNGDGNGRNTHLSLFFVILRGEFDSLLRWPFRQKVTFTLLDQSESKENIVDAFRPDPNSSSFRRPISEMNIASGLPVFCPLGKLMSTEHEYIKDNTLFIRINVDCKELQEA